MGLYDIFFSFSESVGHTSGWFGCGGLYHRLRVVSASGSSNDDYYSLLISFFSFSLYHFLTDSLCSFHSSESETRASSFLSHVTLYINTHTLIYHCVFAFFIFLSLSLSVHIHFYKYKHVGSYLEWPLAKVRDFFVQSVIA